MPPAAPAVAIPKPPGPAAPKKETAKIALPKLTKTVPQATMNLKAPVPSIAPVAAPVKAKPSVDTDSEETETSEVQSSSTAELILGIAATITALLALGVQIWTYLG